VFAHELSQRILATETTATERTSIFATKIDVRLVANSSVAYIRWFKISMYAIPFNTRFMMSSFFFSVSFFMVKKKKGVLKNLIFNSSSPIALSTVRVLPLFILDFPKINDDKTRTVLITL